MPPDARRGFFRIKNKEGMREATPTVVYSGLATQFNVGISTTHCNHCFLSGAFLGHQYAMME
jgi:hypothetical protein